MQRQESATDLSNLDRMTDREIHKIDLDCKRQITILKGEKEKRSKIRRSHENLSQNSSGHLKNFMRPYNPPACMYSTNRKTSSQKSLSQRSAESPAYIQNSRDRIAPIENSFKETRNGPARYLGD